MKKVSIIIIAILLFSWFIYSENKRKREVDKVGLEDLNLQLVGVVDSVDNGDNFHGYGIIRLKIISSNIQEYDPRSKQEFYFCIIKNGMAEIYEHTFVSKVDTVTIDTKKKTMSYIENGKEVVGSISINANEGYYDYIKQKTIFK